MVCRLALQPCDLGLPFSGSRCRYPQYLRRRWRQSSFNALVLLLLGSAFPGIDAAGQLTPSLGAGGSFQARHIALGGAFLGSMDGTGAVFAHPSLLTGGGVGGTYWGARRNTSLTALSGTTPWLGGTVGAGIAGVRPGVARGAGNTKRSRDYALGAKTDHWSLLVLGFARDAGRIRIGAAAKLIEEGSSLVVRRTAALDLSASLDIDWGMATLTARQISSDALRKSRRHAVSAPRLVAAAQTDRAPLGPLDVAVAAQVSVDADGVLRSGGGVEVAWWPVFQRVFILRFGLREEKERGSPFSFGAGFAGDRIRLDFAAMSPSKGERAGVVSLSFW